MIGKSDAVKLVKAQMGADPFSGTIYVFRAKRRDRIKLIFWCAWSPSGMRMSSSIARMHDGCI
ncbi:MULTISPECIES: IS66 family insertion sequence element accessory protein TnpB [Rhizobium]|uniref:Transposase n=1 Tax=Rhizobium binae TaxID=1138190 RepID=A0ABV2MPC3_9HYPH|nr:MULTISPECIES: IS66 family insertion sequence element accessory protein TnpB [Rhizobium]NKL51913.1 hypothetical protein [Rhizobium leguminosarum bv. viciae]MBX4910915.1 hypothetical protein [Rhizobium bangladeshense]MBX4938040.1 hypothetical protein [Rhizobium binae]MBX4944404.1 hypothetical protein [Rhizobium binae]MBX4949188.1 hypothetical protein [Rhizobium binae]